METDGTTILNVYCSRTNLRWGLGGLVILGLHLAFSRLSSHFTYGSDPVAEPIPQVVVILVAGGISFLYVVRRGAWERGPLWWILGIGVALRLTMLASTPVLENDFYRYLWDGAVTASGNNPYANSPAEAAAVVDSQGAVPSAVRRLARESGSVVERVNHPRLRTIYPPVAQAFFALAHLLAPWSLLAWRLVLLFVDGTVLLLLLIILRRLELPPTWCAIYWWNPLLVKEVFNSGHMDVLVLPFVLGALLLASRAAPVRASAMLAVATGVKIWPIAILPLVLIRWARRPRVLFTSLLLFGIVVGLLAVPIVFAGFDSTSGFTAYGQHWEMNDALFGLVAWGTRFLSGATGILAGREQLATRFLIAIALCAWIAVVVLRPGTLDLSDLCERSLLIVAGLFLLSPTQFPWYSLWLFPFLAVHPRVSLLSLTALLPLYYLRFYFVAHGDASTFDNGVVWIEWTPIWLLLILELFSARALDTVPQTGEST